MFYAVGDEYKPCIWLELVLIWLGLDILVIMLFTNMYNSLAWVKKMIYQKYFH